MTKKPLRFRGVLLSSPLLFLLAAQAWAEKVTPVNVVNTSVPVTVQNSVPVTLQNAPSVTVNNTSASPVPVSVVADTPKTVVECMWQLDLYNPQTEFSHLHVPFNGELAGAHCGILSGATIEIQRFVYTPYGGQAGYQSENVSSYLAQLSSSTGDVIAVSSRGSPDGRAIKKIHFTFAGTNALVFDVWNSSGVAGINSKAGGAFYLIGTLVQ